MYAIVCVGVGLPPVPKRLVHRMKANAFIDYSKLPPVYTGTTVIYVAKDIVLSVSCLFIPTSAINDSNVSSVCQDFVLHYI